MAVLLSFFGVETIPCPVFPTYHDSTFIDYVVSVEFNSTVCIVHMALDQLQYSVRNVRLG